MIRRPINRLVVEGKFDRYALTSILECYVPWKQSAAGYPVDVQIAGSRPEMCEKGKVRVNILGTESVRNIGFVVDADNNSVDAFASISGAIREVVPDFPTANDPGGVVHAWGDKRVGVWVMPDNNAPGSVETLLVDLVDDEAFFQYVQNSTVSAAENGATYKPTQLDKACFHAWRSWHEDPVISLEAAFSKSLLNKNSPLLTPYVNWCNSLFDLGIE